MYTVHGKVRGNPRTGGLWPYMRHYAKAGCVALLHWGPIGANTRRHHGPLQVTHVTTKGNGQDMIQVKEPQQCSIQFQEEFFFFISDFGSSVKSKSNKILRKWKQTLQDVLPVDKTNKNVWYENLLRSESIFSHVLSGIPKAVLSFNLKKIWRSCNELIQRIY